MSQILITGASGFIGSHLLDLLIEKNVKAQNIRVLDKVVLDRNYLDLGVEFIEADLRDKKAIKKAMKNISTVFHLAARIDFDGQNYADYYDVNVLATKYLLQRFIIENKGNFRGKFIFYSSIGVHGLPAALGNIENFNEKSPPLYTNFYGRSKWEAEILVRRFHKKFNLPYAIIRPASVYGPREKGPTLALFKAIKNKQFLLIGDGQNKMHYVYVTDLAMATYLAFKSKLKSGEYIIGGEKPVTLNKLAKLISENLNTKIWPIKFNKNLALLVAYILKFTNKITGINFPLFPDRVRTMTSSYYYDISKAKKKLHYSPNFGIKKGIELTSQYYFKNKYL